MTGIINCSHCSKPITGDFFKDYWGNNYHIKHKKTVPVCNYCGRLISTELTNGGKSYSDGRNICGLCLSTSISDLIKGKKILEMVHDKLAISGIKITPFTPEFYLIDRDKLWNLAGKVEKQGFARFERILINGNINSFKLQIYILKGLPESSFIGAAAHELMHIWFYSYNITDISPKLLEGSCNYASFLLYNCIKNKETAYRIHELIEDRSPVYGRGFKKIYNMVQSKGIEYWLNYIKTHKR